MQEPSRYPRSKSRNLRYIPEANTGSSGISKFMVFLCAHPVYCIYVQNMSVPDGWSMQYKPPFLNEVQRVLRLRGYAYQTEKTYIYWIRYYTQ